MPKLAGAVPRPTYQLDELLIDWFMVFVTGKFRCCVTGCNHVWDGFAENGGKVVLESDRGRRVGEICQKHVDELTSSSDLSQPAETRKHTRAILPEQSKRPEWVLGPDTVHIDGLADAYAAGWVEGRCSSGNHGPEPSPSDVAAEFGLWCDKTGLVEADRHQPPRAARVAHHNANLGILLEMLARSEVYPEDFDPGLLRRLADALKIPPF